MQMKAFAVSTRIVFFSLLVFSLVMAEENQQKEVPQEPSHRLMAHQGLVSGGVDAGAGSRRVALDTAPKREWPEVVGLTVEEAKKKIKEDMPMARFQVVLPNCFVTMDFDLGRVRLYVDSSNKVARPPRTG
ncbi:subtilisin-chymotrypsin inhibitor-2A-like [Magnolia sinica]|uniref:subtilisin-chymotrypsin inhibitor-2A-like n=1 Tax=Magnolia sinica TaxID=86752 RepID=UPI00265AE179|nr:subtilisin-chymotrypsin inhibitor-2A-like [Magnolia sinica]